MSAFDTYRQMRDSTLRNGENARQEEQRNALLGAQQQAGAALGSGDYAGGANALFGAGDIDGGLQVQQRQRTNAASDLTTQQAAQDRQKAALVSGAQSLRYLPPEQRWAAYQSQVLPGLQREGLTPDILGSISQDHMGDADLDSVIALAGGEVERGTPINAGNGRIVRPDPYTGQMVELSPAQDPSAPAGYRWTDDHNLELIPGGPADPTVRGSQAAATRAPRRGGGGGSRPSGGSARPAAPAGRPWERSW